MFVTEEAVVVQRIEAPWLRNKGIELHIARLDLLHPVVSGNKLFKLKHYVSEAKKNLKNIIVTKGGAYSNHLAAAAYYCKTENLQSVGIVRGEQPDVMSHTLKSCIEFGMRLIFTPRSAFSSVDSLQAANLSGLQTDQFAFIPEGGYGEAGKKGAAEIMASVDGSSFTHICTAVGTATTLAGLMEGAGNQLTVVGVPVIKGPGDLNQRLTHLLGSTKTASPMLLNDYHFGGYARKTDELTSFMNDFYLKYQIPSDFVYTGKMLFAVTDQIEKGCFPSGSRILCLHTGGLQGNLSLPKGTLIF